MNPSDIAVALLLVVGVGVLVVCAIGLVAIGDCFDRLHVIGPASTVAPLAIAAAIVVREGIGPGGVKSIIVAVLLLVTSPVLTHATARAARVRQFGHWKPAGAEEIDRD